MLETAIVGRRFEILERIDPEDLVQASREHATDARHGCQHVERVGLAAQPVEHRQPAVREHVANRVRDGVSDSRQPAQTVECLGAPDLVDRPSETPQLRGRAEVRAYAEAVRALAPKDAADLFEPRRDARVDVQVDAFGRPPDRRRDRGVHAARLTLFA